MCGYTMSVDWSNVGSADATGVTHITLDLPPEITTSGAQFFGSPPAYVFTESVSPDGHPLDGVFNGTIMPGGDSFMKVQVCAASPPSGPVVATVGNANDVNLANNTYVGSAFGTAPPTPVVAGVDPAGGPGGGTAVTVTGSNLADGLVLFGGMVGTANSCTATSCTATAPAGSGTVDVTVLTAGGASAPTTADQYSYAGTPQAVPIPAVTRLTTTGGPEAGGTQIYVNGSSLTYGTVAFAGCPGCTARAGRIGVAPTRRRVRGCGRHRDHGQSRTPRSWYCATRSPSCNARSAYPGCRGPTGLSWPPSPVGCPPHTAASCP